MPRGRRRARPHNRQSPGRPAFDRGRHRSPDWRRRRSTQRRGARRPGGPSPPIRRHQRASRPACSRRPLRRAGPAVRAACRASTASNLVGGRPGDWPGRVSGPPPPAPGAARPTCPRLPPGRGRVPTTGSSPGCRSRRRWQRRTRPSGRTAASVCAAAAAPRSAAAGRSRGRAWRRPDPGPPGPRRSR